MIYEVAHTTTYAYSGPVFLDTHDLRLRPRVDGSQRLIRYEAQVSPAPVGQTDHMDLEGNVVTQVWFKGLTKELRVHSKFEVETLRNNPFDYLPDTRTASLPVTYPCEIRNHTVSYLMTGSPQPAVTRFAQRVFDESGGQTIPFLAALNNRVYQTCIQTYREEGPPQRAEVTLGEGQGSCRDLAVLFMECCRYFGLAARFVSGYQEGTPEQSSRYLHAWAEVYLPGGGWRGYDPSHGLAVSDRHIAVAAASHSREATPISGTFRGTNVTWTMDARIDIRVR